MTDGIRWKRYLLAKPLWTWDHKYEIYELGLNPKWPDLYVSLSDGEQSGSGYTLATIEKYCEFNWYFFDELGDAETYLKEMYHPRFIRYPKDDQQVIWCPACWRAYSVINENWEYDDSTTHHVRTDCVCGCSMTSIVNITRVVTYDVETKMIEGK